MNKRFRFDFEIFDFFEGMCFIISSDGKILDANKASLDKLKFAPNMTNLFNIIEFEEREILRTAINKCINNQKPSEHTAKFNINDQLLFINLSLSPYNSNENGISGEKLCLIIANDITQKKEREEDLQRFFYVAENTVNPLQITDTEGRMIYVNPAFLKVSGYTKEELMGKNPSVFGSKKQMKRFWSEMWTTIKSGKVWIGDVENKKKSGEPFQQL
jgi:PAS domain S-box-containing protein